MKDMFTTCFIWLKHIIARKSNTHTSHIPYKPLILLNTLSSKDSYLTQVYIDGESPGI